ncbi:branched-chain amino acid aminotransferase II [Aspergillus brunneoviolaceus CBS 621.78]|uniref:Branched-chain amino acid aminotransferase II n=1 Tax=Aspergillus brunneoviolaceus CBS 621.78 TaxID=1450534 RepID=A0ACD1GQM8_9EURO|nr:branched-chain amino acid aminotransferase II [Aspergillus brunneoviolaceus CBS 621.78]RAH51427.1 branched-chain amino acid aminotransferase II [Aspergillus brunneoviolaceus CBS 621.78]
MGSSQPLDASRLTYTFTAAPREVPDAQTLSSTRKTICTDHMITASWNAESGWSAPELKPYGPLSLEPSASCLHYAYECFEGLKAYRGHDGKLRMFRTDRNTRRLLMSAQRISLPEFDPDELEKLIYTLLSVDGTKWLPRDRTGSFLYVRPTIIGTDSQLGVARPTEALLYIIVGYMARLDAPAGGKRLLTNPDDTVRSWVGGFGYAKVGANYGPAVLATQEAFRQGYHQILWLYGPDGSCTEAGGSNFFVVWQRREDGKKELVTAPLDDRLILDGVTRRSCLELVRERLKGEVEVSERKFTIGDLLEAAAENRLLESFAAGTAWFITPISLIHHRQEDIHIPTGPDGTPGEITGMLKGWLGDMMYGRVEHEWARVVAERGENIE